MDVQGQLVNPDGALDGWNLTVSNKAGVEEMEPAIAYDGATHKSLVVWNKHDFPTDEYDVYGRLFSKDVAQGPDEFAIANVIGYAEAGPAVVFNPIDNQFLVVWVDDRFVSTHSGEIFGKRFDTSGNPVGSDIHISGTGGNAEGGDQVTPTVAFNPTGRKFLVAWEDGRNGNPDIYGRVIDHDGGLPGNTFPLSTPASDQTHPALAFDTQNKRFLALWQDDRNMGTTGTDLFGQWFDGNGLALGPNFTALRAAEDQKFPKVAYGAGSFLAAYEIDYTAGPVLFDVGFKPFQGPGFLFLPLTIKN